MSRSTCARWDRDLPMTFNLLATVDLDTMKARRALKVSTPHGKRA